MANNKQIEISANVQLQTTQAEQQAKKLSKAFKDAFEKTNANKMFDEFRKISPLVGQIDASLNKMLKGMSRDDARKQLKLMNEALKDQSKQLDQNINKYKELTSQIESASEAQRKSLEHEREVVVKKARENMGKMQEFGQRRDEAKQNAGGMSSFDYLKMAAIMATTGRVGSSIANFAGGFDFRKMGYEAQRDMTTNNYLSGITSGGLDLGIAGAAGKTSRAMAAADSAQTGQYVGKALTGIGDTLAGAAGGFAMGGPIGAVIGGGGALGSHIGANADLLAMKEARQANLAGLQQEAISNGLASTSFVRELASERMGKAHGRMSAMEAIGTKDIGKNLSRGRSLGFGEGEIISAMGMIGQSGLLGKERTNIEPALKLQRQGLATVEQTGGLLSGAMTGLSKQTNVMEQLKKAMTEGTKKGVETSLVKDLVGATIQIANQGSARSQDLDTFQKLMETALGSKKASEVGRADIAAAQTAVSDMMSLRGGGNNPVLQAMRMLGVQSQFSKTGIDINKMTEADIFSLSKAASATQVTDSQRKALLEAAGGDQGKVDKFMKGFDQQAQLDVLKGLKPGSGILGQISSDEGFASFQARQQKGGKAAELERSKLASELQVARGLSRDESERQADLLAGVQMKGSGKAEDVTGKTLDRSLATLNASMEGVRDSLLGQKEVSGILSNAIKQTYETAKQLTDPNNPQFKPLLQIANGEAQLNVSMQDLTRAVIENTRAIKGEKSDAGIVDKAMSEIHKRTLGMAENSFVKAMEEQNIRLGAPKKQTLPLNLDSLGDVGPKPIKQNRPVQVTGGTGKKSAGQRNVQSSTDTVRIDLSE